MTYRTGQLAVLVIALSIGVATWLSPNNASAFPTHGSKHSNVSLTSTLLQPTVSSPPTSPSAPAAEQQLIREVAQQRAAAFHQAQVAQWLTVTYQQEQAQEAAARAAAAEAQSRALAASQQQATESRQASSVATPTPATDSSSIWQCIIDHESGGNPGAVNSSSGAGGLFQFLPSSWAAYGGSGLPEDASVGEQWAIAEHAQAVSGWYPWVGDGCTPVG